MEGNPDAGFHACPLDKGESIAANLRNMMLESPKCFQKIHNTIVGIPVIKECLIWGEVIYGEWNTRETVGHMIIGSKMKIL